jgi:hypothetical protein
LSTRNSALIGIKAIGELPVAESRIVNRQHIVFAVDIAEVLAVAVRH